MDANEYYKYKEILGKFCESVGGKLVHIVGGWQEGRERVICLAKGLGDVTASISIIKDPEYKSIDFEVTVNKKDDEGAFVDDIYIEKISKLNIEEAGGEPMLVVEDASRNTLVTIHKATELKKISGVNLIRHNR